MTADTAPLVKYLKTDLQRIVNSANEELKSIRRAGLDDSTRQTEETRVISDARAFAVRRVESTVRHLHNVKTKSPAQPVNGAADVEKPPQFTLAPPTPSPETSAAPAESEAVLESDSWETAALQPESLQPESLQTEAFQAPSPFDSDDTEVLEELANLLQEISPTTAAPVEPAARPEPPEPPAPPPVSMFEPPIPQPASAHPAPQMPAELEHERLERLLKFVARQEPGLRWAVGLREDRTTLLVTDLAHGWIPPGITLPAEVHLLEPARRKGTAKSLLGETTLAATYAPGDPLGWAADYEVTDTSSQPRELPEVDDLGWLLSEATHWRDGLPRLVNTLAKAGAAGTGIVDAELDILRVYLDTSRYQLLAQYPDVDAGLLLNCLLLAATEGIAARNRLNANYHFAWFQVLNAPLASGWKTGA